MSTSIHPDHFDPDTDLTREVAQLHRQLKGLLKRLNRRTDPDADYTINEWCAKRRVSRAEYYKMKHEGRGPDTVENGGVVRITAAADRAWEQRWSSRTTPT